MRKRPRGFAEQIAVAAVEGKRWYRFRFAVFDSVVSVMSRWAVKAVRPAAS
jgi:hypothetical protein